MLHWPNNSFLKSLTSSIIPSCSLVFFFNHWYPGKHWTVVQALDCKRLSCNSPFKSYHLQATYHSGSIHSSGSTWITQRPRLPFGHSQGSTLCAKRRKKELPSLFKAKIHPHNFLPYECQQNEQGAKALSDYNLQKKFASQLKLSGNWKQAAEKAQDKGDSTFKHVFESNCKFNLQPVNRIYSILIT